jgi:hypothetical protein
MIALLSITAYFMSENKKLTSKMNSLSEKVEEQEEKLQKHEQVLFDILRQMESNKVTPSLPPPQASSSSSISYKPICITTSSGNQVCTPSFGLEKVEEEDEEEEEEEYEDESHLNVILISPPTSIPLVPFTESKVEEIIEEEERPAPVKSPPPLLPSSSEKKKRKRHNKKKTTQVSSLNDIDKELENELNELFKEEILSSH